MRYLKTYKIFESGYKKIEDTQVEEITQTIKDILLPVSDLGYSISVTDNTPDEFIIRVVTYVDKSLQLSDVKEDFIRMVDYLESLGFNQIDALYVIDGRTFAWPTDLKTRRQQDSQVRTKFSEFIEMDGAYFRNLLFHVKVKESGVSESKLFESVDELIISDIISTISDSEIANYTITGDQVIIGIGDEDKIYNPDGSQPEDLRDISSYESDLMHLNSYLEEMGYVLSDAQIWEKSTTHTYSDKATIYDFSRFIDFIKKNKIIYCDIMWKKKV
jgi:hypothetical protein